MADRLHLQRKHRQMLESLLREHLPEVEVWAYGSRVTGRSHDGSDLDLALRGPELKKIPAGKLADFEDAVRESNIPFLVEARDWARLPERFHREIERRHVLLVPIHRNLDEAGNWSERLWRDVATLEYGKGLRDEMRQGPVPVFGTNGQIGWHDEPLCTHPGVVIGRKGALSWGPLLPQAVPRNRYGVLPTTKDRSGCALGLLQLTHPKHQRHGQRVRDPLHQPGRVLQSASIGPAARRTTRHRPHSRHTGRQDRVEPVHERDLGGDGAGAVQVVVRGLRASAGKDGWL